MSFYAMTEIPAEPVWGIVAGLVIIALMVLILPFKVKFVEHNLEVFFLVMGILGVTVSQCPIMTSPGWRACGARPTPSACPSWRTNRCSITPA